MKLNPKDNPELFLPKAPDNIRLYVVGDIHGKIDLFIKLCDMMYEDALKHNTPIKIIYLGDYIDRGEDSKAVIDAMLSLKDADIEQIFIKGNHENAMMQFMENPEDIYEWLMWGGNATLKSYGAGIYDENGNSINITQRSQLFNKLMPKRHKEFYANLKSHHIEGDYIFVHGGVRPNIAIEDQSKDDMMRIRREFIEATPTIDKTVVFGHTIFEKPFEEIGKIGIDSGSYKTNNLTCVVLFEQERYFISTDKGRFESEFID